MYSLEVVAQTISRLKHPADYSVIPRLPVIVDGATNAFLRPVPAQLAGEASGDAHLIAGWRNAYKTAFFTWIHATVPETAAWLRDSYAEDPHDIIFIFESLDRKPIGQLGICNFDAQRAVCELGRFAVDPGEKRNAQVMLNAARAAILWAIAALEVREFFLEVFEDNLPAIWLYQRFGFVAAERIPLLREETPRGIAWKKSAEGRQPEAVSKFALRMTLTADKVLNKPDVTRADSARPTA